MSVEPKETVVISGWSGVSNESRKRGQSASRGGQWLCLKCFEYKSGPKDRHKEKCTGPKR